jgi:F-type H+-transporting ATPase subunit b
MNTNKLGFAKPAATAGALSIALQLAAPATAYAAGADILIPKPAEFIPALIAFLIIWVIMAKMAWPMIIKVLDERQEKIQSDLDEAAKLRWDADDAKAAYYGLLEEADLRADEVLAEAKRDAEVLRADMLAQAQRESQAIIAKAHDVIDAEREKAMAELSSSVVDLSVEIASKVIGDALDEEQQRALAIKYLSEVGSLNED